MGLTRAAGAKIKNCRGYQSFDRDSWFKAKNRRAVIMD
jgi:hypothetical protein